MNKLININWILLGMNLMCMFIVVFGVFSGLIPSNIRWIIIRFQLAICIAQGILFVIIVKNMREK